MCVSSKRYFVLRVIIIIEINKSDFRKKYHVYTKKKSIPNTQNHAYCSPATIMMYSRFAYDNTLEVHLPISRIYNQLKNTIMNIYIIS